MIIADGFNPGKSDLKKLYQFLEGEQYGFIGELRRRGMDVILLGFKNRTASVLDNAEAVEATVRESIARRVGNHRLVVGGFSMGGLITRYALARMESQAMDHQTGVYFSYDTPHRGASIPIGVQAFSYLLPRGLDLKPHPFTQQMDSPAARQMLWQHYDNKTGKTGVAPEREALLTELDRVGRWPQIRSRWPSPTAAATASGCPRSSPERSRCGSTSATPAPPSTPRPRVTT